MLRVLGGIWDILRELMLALIGQPSRPGPTRLEREAYLVKHRNLRRNLQKRANAWDAAEQIGLEAGKVAIMQPTAGPVDSDAQRTQHQKRSRR